MSVLSICRKAIGAENHSQRIAETPMPDSPMMTVDQMTMANAIRALSMDAVQKANSGHPGMPMGMADVATVLFTQFLKFDPAKPDWPDRDRFVLSAGHGSMLLYSALHLVGYERPTMDDIRNFRQLGWPCAGHPEYGALPGIESTTGPLGQGLAMAAGMALAERKLASDFGSSVVDHNTYVIAGDGCLMEGISHEAISFAGHQKLGKLILFWDNNEISIDGGTDLSVSDNQVKRFEASGWHVQSIDGHDHAAIAKAIEAAQIDTRPSMIACRTTIGYGSPNKQGTSATHGAPLGEDEITATREALGWSSPAFEIPQPVLDRWREAGTRCKLDVEAWNVRLGDLTADKREAFESALDGGGDMELSQAMAAFKSSLIEAPINVATRKASGMALEVINSVLPTTIGGSADLTGSNNTLTADLGTLSPDEPGGRYIYYGVREFAMGALMNGMALHGGIIPYGGTFLVFADYARGAMRLSALMKQRVIYVMTHDSIGLGEDGPTHQPVEHLASMRAMPGINVFRPADAIETAECWELALAAKDTPSMIVLTRQSLPQLRLRPASENLCARGAYILYSSSETPDVVLIGTGSEVSLAIEAARVLEGYGISANVVSMPSWSHFDAQDDAYKSTVIPENTLKVSIEAASTLGWSKYVGSEGIVIGMDSFGASAPATDLFKHFGITAERMVEAVRERIG